MKHIKNLDRTICSLILFLLIIITVLQIILRSLFNIPFVGVEELSRYFFIAFVFSGLAYYYRTDGHIKLDGLRNYLPEKLDFLLQVLIQIISVLVFSILLISAVYTTITNYDSNTPTLSIPFWLFFLPIILGFGLLVKEHVKSLIYTINHS